MANIEQILARIPDYGTFYTVDELNAKGLWLSERHSGLIERFSIGKSRLGEELWCLKIGGGAKNAICFACPHPNEPIGAMTLITLAEILAGEAGVLAETDMTWYLIPCIDPDSTRLNEGWFKGPFTIENYARGFYRPSGARQVEWTFPFEWRGESFDRPIPETRALMSLIENTKPSFVFSLHNLAFGGAYWYLTEDDKQLCAALENSAHRQDVPLHLGEPESPYITKYSPAVHSMMSMREYYEFLEKKDGKAISGPLNGGTCSADFINTVCDCVTMMAEVPYFVDRRIGDVSPSGMNYGELRRQGAALKSERFRFLIDRWDKIKPFIGADNLFPLLAKEIIEYNRKPAEQDFSGAEYEREATVAEKVDNLYLSGIFDILNLGLLSRACTFELSRGNHAQAEIIEAVKAELDAELSRQCRDIEDHTAYEVLPIQKLVAVQLESALAAAAYVNNHPLKENK